MPNVRASSGMIGTQRAPNVLSRMRSFSSRTNAIVVAIFCLPEPRFASLYASVFGRSSLRGVFRRSGMYPPRAWRRSCMYAISSESLPGW